MKIEINLMTNGIPLIQQMEAIDIYIKKNTISSIKHDYFGEEISEHQIDNLVLFETLTLKTTPKNDGEKIKADSRNFHVSCKKTKGGMYKFKIWQG